VRVDEPYVELNLFGSFIFEHADHSAPGDPDPYYAPDRAMSAAGGLSASAWIPVGEASSLNLGGRASAGMSWEQGTADEATFEVEANLGLSKGEAFYSLRSAYSGPFDLDSGDYWSFYLGLALSTQLPQLLAP